MSELLEKIHTRGYWHVVIRPTKFDDHRLEIAQLFPLVEKNNVRLRGWYYPHIDYRTPPLIDLDWVGQEHELSHYLEIWRMYRSGQFGHVFGIREDWRDQSAWWPAPEGWNPETMLSVLSTLFQYTEIFEFAARLAQAIEGDDKLHVAITLHGLDGRKLWSDDWEVDTLLPEFRATAERFPYTVERPRTEFIASSRELALEPVRHLFQLFGWNVSSEFLREEQGKLLNRK